MNLVALAFLVGFHFGLAVPPTESQRAPAWTATPILSAAYRSNSQALLKTTGALQGTLEDAMSGRDGTALVLQVDTAQIIASYRMDVAARRVTTPGSTMKPFTLTALIAAGLVTEETTFTCPNTVRVGGRTLDCSHDPIGPMTAVMALAHSCNHFFIRASERLPIDSLQRTFSLAGLNLLTGKWNSELSGLVSLPESRTALQLMSIGQEHIAVTPLGLAEAYRSLAVRSREPAIRLVFEGLGAAVKVGTARLAASREIQIAGKTGTSAGHAWFAGFAPAERPEIVVIVFLEEGRGGNDAAPIAGRIFAAYSAQAGK